MVIKEIKKPLNKKGNKNPKNSSKTKIRQLAHEIYLNRMGEGMAGDAESDWYEAENALNHSILD